MHVCVTTRPGLLRAGPIGRCGAAASSSDVGVQGRVF